LGIGIEKRSDTVSTSVNVHGSWNERKKNRIRMEVVVDEWPEVVRLKTQGVDAGDFDVSVFLDRFGPDALDQFVRDLAHVSLAVEVYANKLRATEKAEKAARA